MAIDYLGSVPIPSAIESGKYSRPVKNAANPDFKKALESQRPAPPLSPKSLKAMAPSQKGQPKAKPPLSHGKPENSVGDGTDLAAMEVAREFRKQFMGLMWNHAFATVSDKFEGGLGEEFFRKEMINEVAGSIEQGYASDIERLAYEELKKGQEAGE